MLHDYTDNMQLEASSITMATAEASVVNPPVPKMIELAWEIVQKHWKDSSDDDNPIYVAASACIVRYFNQTRHEIVVKT